MSADVWLLNSCTVKNPSERTFLNAIRGARAMGKRVVVAGCVPQAQPRNVDWSGLSMVGVQQIDRIVEIVEETLQGRTVQWLGNHKRPLTSHANANASDHHHNNDTDHDHDDRETQRQRKLGGARLDLPKIRKNPFVEIIPINTGCLNQCTYCKTKHARGDLGSYEPAEIFARVQDVLLGRISSLSVSSSVSSSVSPSLSSGVLCTYSTPICLRSSRTVYTNHVELTFLHLRRSPRTNQPRDQT